MEEAHSPYTYSETDKSGMEIDFVKLTDGRSIAINRTGYGEHTIFDFHGSPGSRINPIPRNFSLSLLGVNVIRFDRPGYGRSTANPGRKVADTADDVRQIADALGVERFGLMARSGGVPHAIGCAALLKDRVSGMVCMASLAPPTELDRWKTGMTKDNQHKHELAKRNPIKLIQEFNGHSLKIRKDQNALYNHIQPEFRLPDKRLFEYGYGSAVQAMVAKSHREALYRGGIGWLEDTLALNHPKGWGFDISDVRCPTLLLHGYRDPFVNTDHVRILHQRIASSRALLYMYQGHFGGLEVMETSLAYLRDRNRQYDPHAPIERPPLDSLARDFRTLQWDDDEEASYPLVF